jgi:hypothetical protein
VGLREALHQALAERIQLVHRGIILERTDTPPTWRSPALRPSAYAEQLVVKHD